MASSSTQNNSQEDDSDSFKSPEEQERYCLLRKQSKDLAKNGEIKKALALSEEAIKIHYSDKLERRIKKMKDYLEEYGNESNDDQNEMVDVGNGFFLYHELYEKLYPYQADGLRWLWKMYKNRTGGILADDMGLGKTIQIISFLSGMFDGEHIKTVLIVMPVSLMMNWVKEFENWAPGINVCQYHGSSKKERLSSLSKIQRRGGVLITSYGMLVTNWEPLSKKDGRTFVWDYAILDEGHKIKNPTKTTKAVHEIPAKNRIALTGTPVQNNLKELWALYDFVHHGTLLGSYQTFKMQYETPITNAREKNATTGERRLGTEMAQNLRKLVEPYFLRRTKQEIFELLKSPENKENLSPASKIAVSKLRNKLTFLKRKNDIIVWLFLSEIQQTIYRDFIELDRVKDLLLTKRSPLVELTILKKICDHPRLLSKRACLQLGLDGNMTEEQIEAYLEDDEAMACVSLDSVTDETLIEESGKIQFVLNLLEKLKAEGHRTLIFSLSRKILDIIQRILVNRQWKVMRLDGTITKLCEREKRIEKFQSDPSYSVFLLTTQVGGVGLTLTAADRVIIYDPSWNPATDAQAVDRAYRIGQDRPVVVYRLITCGTVEEKIYRRQIFKDSITKQAVGAHKDPHRYFTREELRDLFVLKDPKVSDTQVQLQELHGHQRRTDETLDEHLAYLHTLNIFGVSDHDLMFSGKLEDKDAQQSTPGAFDNPDYIKQRVEMAQKLIKADSDNVRQELAATGDYFRPYTMTLQTKKQEKTADNYKPPAFPESIDLEVKNEPKVENLVPTEEELEQFEIDADTTDLEKLDQTLSKISLRYDDSGSKLDEIEDSVVNGSNDLFVPDSLEESKMEVNSNNEQVVISDSDEEMVSIAGEQEKLKSEAKSPKIVPPKKESPEGSNEVPVSITDLIEQLREGKSSEKPEPPKKKVSPRTAPLRLFSSFLSSPTIKKDKEKNENQVEAIDLDELPDLTPSPEHDDVKRNVSNSIKMEKSDMRSPSNRSANAKSFAQNSEMEPHFYTATSSVLERSKHSITTGFSPSANPIKKAKYATTPSPKVSTSRVENMHNRITPLRLNSTNSPSKMSPFQKALAKSMELSFSTSTPVVTTPPAQLEKSNSESIEDSPVFSSRKPQRRRIMSSGSEGSPTVCNMSRRSVSRPMKPINAIEESDTDEDAEKTDEHSESDECTETDEYSKSESDGTVSYENDSEEMDDTN